MGRKPLDNQVTEVFLFIIEMKMKGMAEKRLDSVPDHPGFLLVLLILVVVCSAEVIHSVLHYHHT